MTPSALIDSGVIIAVLDRRDYWHGACVDAVSQARLPLLTSEAVLAEVFHLAAAERREVEAVWRFLESGAISLAGISHAELPAIRELMVRYRDRPMDFADGTLVHLAQRESIQTILTVDHNDFETYRIGARRRFRIVPARQAKR